jgi:hypothetical protein
MDSTACLVGSNAGSNASHVDLSFQFLPAGQRDMEQNNPITRHLELKVSLVAARFCLLRLREYGTHTWVRHVSLNRNVRTRYILAGAINQFKSDRSGSDPSRFRRNYMLNFDNRSRFRRSGTSRYQQGCRAGESGHPFRRPRPENATHHSPIRQPFLPRAAPTRTCRPGSRARPREGTRGNTSR